MARYGGRWEIGTYEYLRSRPLRWRSRPLPVMAELICYGHGLGDRFCRFSDHPSLLASEKVLNDWHLGALHKIAIPPTMRSTNKQGLWGGILLAG